MNYYRKMWEEIREDRENFFPRKVLTLKYFKFTTIVLVFVLGTHLNPSNHTADTKCKGKADGNYALRDVFKYLRCEKEKSTIVNCKSGEIYSPSAKECAVISSTTIESFCKNRADGDWQNPWNCHGYLMCRSGYTVQRPCRINGYVFDPENDVCRQSFPCVTARIDLNDQQQPIRHVPSALGPGFQLPQINDICSYLEDGNYTTRDVLLILQCKDHVSHVIPCPKDTIYVGGASCTNASLVTEGLCFISILRDLSN